MDLFSLPSSPLILYFSLTLFLLSRGVLGTTFTFVNKCDNTVWPGILANAGSPRLDSTGFELPKDSSRTFQAPTGWSGRFWGRTGCNFDGSESGSCSTADCGSGQAECNGAGATPPATLAEITLGSGGQDFYDVSLVDGYNLPMIVETSGGSGMCATTGCVTDLNLQCPAELRVGDGEACKSACEAFGSPEYCCKDAFNSPAACKPSVYSEMFKSACPRSYSYAYDDPTSTFTCSGADYTVTFCPSMPSQKSTRDSPYSSTTTADGSGSGMTGSGSGSETMGSGSGSGSAMLADGSWLAGLAMGDSTMTLSPSTLHSLLITSSTFSFILSFLYL
ncbi:thaumatin-like protein 1 [Camellia sinensis]|uniref:thaumatin-like protein 1 n=1 Tax=Camellia sinensis TaxID=4442 RepID=UPI0010359447|nr:thaumatin-like protein 1 [Camellia sinensis]